MIALFWIMFSILIGVWAARWERRGFVYFLAALFFSPVLIALFMLIEGRGGKKCPACKEMILSDALKCKHCGETFSKAAA